MNDPMDALRLPVVPVAPRPAFAAELRARVANWLGGDDDPPASAAPTTAAAAGVAPLRADDPRFAVTLSPMLSVDGAAAAIAWYIEVFGAVPMSDPIMEDNGRVGHMELRFGNVNVSIADEYPELDIVGPRTRGGTSMALQLIVDDCDATFERAVAAGAGVRREPADEFYGARVAEVEDRWGHRWHLHEPTETVSADEMARRLEGTEFRLDELGVDVDVPTIDLGSRAAPVHDQNRAANQVGDLGYFTLGVPDADITAAFFGSLFGWHVEQGALADGRHIASISPPGGIHGGADQPVITAYFRVDDLQAATARVRELGGEVLSVADYPSGGNASCRDPQGLPFELWKPAPGY